MKKRIALLILSLFFIAILVGAYRYLKFTKEYASTDAMFIRTDRISTLSFKKVKGKIVKMNFKEGDRVKKGDVLAEIDPVDYMVKLKEIEARIKEALKEKESVEVKLNRLKAQLCIKKREALKKVEFLKSKLFSIKYEIEQEKVKLKQLKRDYLRFKTLYKEKAVPKRKYEEAETSFEFLKNRVNSLLFLKDSILKKLDIAKEEVKIVEEDFKKVDELKKRVESISKKIEVLKAKKEDVENLISYCRLKAPFSGKIGKKYAEVGMNVRSSTPVYSLVDTENLYVEVLLEETKVRGVKEGCRAYFKVDAYPDIVYKGVVEKIYPASAATYALVPRDISAGEFTKVAQRIIVRVKITDGDKSLLIPGMGGEIRIKRAEN